MEIDYRLTTIDNPFDPFDEFVSWNLYDTTELGYYTCSRIARLTKFTDDMTDKEIEAENERVIDEIIKHDLLGVYKKVKRNTETG